MERSEQEIIRREKLARIRGERYPYPNDVVVTSSCEKVVASANDQAARAEAERDVITVAGRIVSVRLMGKAAFFNLQDRSGRLQVYLKRDEVGEEQFELFKTYDLGDIVEVSGYAFITKTGEPSLHARSARLLVKCLHPLQEKWHGLTDIEIRYRQRYLDLIVNPEVQTAFVKRAKIISEIRRFFDARGYIEVETPMMHAVPGGANARPFVTHHNTLDIDLYMRIALELPLKRLLVGGLERVYELSRVFRNEGMSTEHNPEFTMLEFYEAYSRFEDLMDLTESLFSQLCLSVNGTSVIEYDGHQIDLTPPYRRLSMLESIYEVGGVSRSFDLNTIEGVKAAAKSVGLTHVEDCDDYGVALFELFDQYVESKLIQPTFITHHPLAISPLARPSQQDGRFTDRFEMFVSGMELANAFSELNDPEDQEQRFIEQLRAAERGDEEAMGLDRDFVTALEYGMPPAAGQGIGIDRLVMLLTGQSSIRDVILFPQMRPVADEV